MHLQVKAFQPILTNVQILLGDNAVITQLGDLYDDIEKSFTFLVKQEMYLTDSVNIDAGGGLPFPKATSKIFVGITEDDDEVQTSQPIKSWIKIGNANIYSVSDFNIFNLFDSAIEAIANVKAYGLAGSPAGETQSIVHISNKIEVAAGAIIHSEKDINLGIGRTSEYFDKSTYDINATTDVFNYTAFPILSAALEAYAENKQINLIDIQSGALLETVGNVSLVTEQGYFFLVWKCKRNRRLSSPQQAQSLVDDTVFRSPRGRPHQETVSY